MDGDLEGVCANWFAVGSGGLCSYNFKNGGDEGESLLDDIVTPRSDDEVTDQRVAPVKKASRTKRV